MEQICKKIESLFLSGEKQNELYSSISELRRLSYQSEGNISLELLRSIINLEKKIVQAKGPKKKTIEDTIFDIFEQIAFTHFHDKNNNHRPRLERRLLDIEKDSSKRVCHKIALEILELSIELFDFNLSRDSYRSVRRQKIIEVLCYLVESYDIPKAFNMCSTALHSNKKNQIHAAIGFYEAHFDLLTDDEKKEVIEKIYSIVPKTEDRSVAVSALQCLVEINEISEMTALSEIDDWKERHYANYA